MTVLVNSGKGLARVIAATTITLLLSAGAAAEAAFTLHARAQPDECFRTLGERAPLDFSAFPATGCDSANGYRPKINETYIWSMFGIVASGAGGGVPGPKLFFGTSANTGCQVNGLLEVFGTGVPEPFENRVLACEFALGPNSQSNGGVIPDAGADTRTPGVYAWLVDSAQLVKLAGPGAPPLPADAQAALDTTVGLRAAVAWNELVLFFGPSLTGGTNAFAFDASTHAFLGWKRYRQIASIRKCTLVDGTDIAYCTVGTAGGGAVLRMTGTADSPFTVSTVGTLASPGANIKWSPSQNRVFVASWARPGTATLTPSDRASIWRGPEHPVSGYPPSRQQWQPIFNIGQRYEPDLIIRGVTALGDLVDCGGDILFGTMLAAKAGGVPHQVLFPALYEAGGAYEGQLADLTERPTAVFAISAAGDLLRQRIRLLYGSEQLPRLSFATQTWEMVANSGGLPSLNLAPNGAGLGNAGNKYVWTAFAHNGRCYLGTFDGTLLAETGGGIDPDEAGADLWAFDNVDTPAVPITRTGGGNPFNYGFRTVFVLDNRVWLGTANPYNLVLPGAPPLFSRGGGWELLELVD